MEVTHSKYLIHIPKTHGREITFAFDSVKSPVDVHRMHLAASDLRGLESNLDWFAIIREPTERIFSLYSRHYRGDFDSFLDAMESPTIKIKDPFILSKPDGVRAPGTILANQWDYIKDSPVHINLFRFGDWDSIIDFIGEQPRNDVYEHKPQPKDYSLLTNERRQRIRKLCAVDYERLSNYFSTS